MYRILCAWCLVAVVALVGCGDSPTSPTTGTTTPTLITEPPATGTLSRNGALTYPYTVQRAGTTTATLTTLTSADDAVKRVGLSLGTWNGQSCQVVIANDSAPVNTVVTGVASTAGPFCARIYDIGEIPVGGSVDYVITITHY